jgi:uncharacterized protein YndB with AHSA1/START domain
LGNKKEVMMEAAGQHNVAVTRVFDASVERVWQAWSDPDLVRQWWGPTGFTCPAANMEFQEGGTSLVCMRAPAGYGGQNLYNTWTYTRIVPMKEFEYVLRFANEHGEALDPATIGLPPGIPNEVRNLNVFRDLGDGRTELSITEYSYATEEAAQLSKLGLEQCLDKMAAVLR